MYTYQFSAQVNMSTFDFSKYAGGSITGFSSTEITITDTAGDTLDVTVRRGGHSKQTTVTLSDRPNSIRDTNQSPLGPFGR